MISINLRLRYSEAELANASSHVIKGENEEKYYETKIYLKKLGDNLFAELLFEDLPAHIKEQIEGIDNSKGDTFEDVLPNSVKERAVIKLGEDTFNKLNDLYNNNEPETVY